MERLDIFPASADSSDRTVFMLGVIVLISHIITRLVKSKGVFG